jgi:hypothetical protein
MNKTINITFNAFLILVILFVGKTTLSLENGEISLLIENPIKGLAALCVAFIIYITMEAKSKEKPLDQDL